MKVIKKYFSIRHTAAMLTFFVVMPFFSLQLYAQQLQALDTSQYHLWNETLIRKISPDSKWVSYLLMYESKKDTLFVKSVNSDMKYSFSESRQGSFFGSNFICKSGSSLVIQNLNTGRRKTLENIHSYTLTADEKYLLYLTNAANGAKNLSIENISGRKVKEINDVDFFQLSDKGHQIVYNTKDKNNFKICKTNVSSDEEALLILQEKTGNVSGFSWFGNKIVFLFKQNETVNLFCYDIEKKHLFKCPFERSNSALPNNTISFNGFRSLLLSSDGKRVFFQINEPGKEKNSNSEIVEIWNSRDKWLGEKKKNPQEYFTIDRTAVWNIEKGSVLQITDRNFPSLFLSGDQSKAFIYNPAAYEPQTKMHGDIDLYAVDLSSGNRWEIERTISQDNLPLPSPDGKFIAYFKDRTLQFYDVANCKRTELNIQESEKFYNQTDMSEDHLVWGIAGWSDDSRNLLVYDQFDLWKIDPNTKNIVRLTYGRENRQVFRISPPLYGNTPAWHPLKNPRPIKLSKGFILSVKDNTKGFSGFYWWSQDKGCTKVQWSDRKITQTVKTSEGKFIWLQQRYDSPSEIMSKSLKENESVIIKTNPQHNKYRWGKAQLIHYQYKGKSLSGVLYTPFGFEEGSKFPLIVYIYEKQSQQLQNYIKPSLHTSDGFNVPHLLDKGYCILLPDVYYEFGALAESVTGSVLAAVDAAETKMDTKELKAALIGHSFGGYEVNLVITQTDRFAAAVAGAGWSDLVSAYLYLGPTLSIPDYYRTEYDQLRIGSSLYENMDAYLKNSPVLFPQKITTPLMGWTGAEDRHVNALQSMEFFFAMRRLNKESLLLMYPKEGHNLEHKKNQEDLTLRIQQWFDHHLKNCPEKEWMMPLAN